VHYVGDWILLESLNEPTQGFICSSLPEYDVFVGVPNGNWAIAHWKAYKKENGGGNIWLKNEETGGYLSVRSNEGWSLGDGVVWTKNQQGSPSIASSWEKVRIEFNESNKKKSSILLDIPNSSFQEEIKFLLNNRKSHPDIYFIIEDEEFCGHRSILMARSQYFNALFNRGLKESRENKIHIKDVSPKTFYSILYYCYTDSVDILEHDNAQDVIDSWIAASLYNLPRMRIILENIFQRNTLNLDNVIPCIQALELLSTDSRENIFTICIEFLKKYQNFIEEHINEFTQETKELLGPNPLGFYKGFLY